MRRVEHWHEVAEMAWVLPDSKVIFEDHLMEQQPLLSLLPLPSQPKVLQVTVVD